MSPLVARVVRFVRQQALLAPGDRLVIALSGGPDSVALLRAMLDSAPILGTAVAGVAHLHHGLRGADADADETFCRELATALGLPIHVDHEDVAARASRTRRSIEAAGHDARADFYRRALEALGADLVATGHTADDVAESVVLHLGRGAGTRGLSGIRPRVGLVVRPLLDVGRPEIVRDLADRGQSFRDDKSNADRRFTRNRVRHDVLPALREAVSPRIVEALGRAARLAWDDEALLDELAQERTARVTRPDGRAWIIDVDALGREPVALRRRIVERTSEQPGHVMCGWPTWRPCCPWPTPDVRAPAWRCRGCRRRYEVGNCSCNRPRTISEDAQELWGLPAPTVRCPRSRFPASYWMNTGVGN